MSSVDQADLQGNILCGYGNAFAHSLYAFVRVDDADDGRRFVGELAERVTNAVPWGNKPGEALNVAVTHAGLRALGVRAEILDSFPEGFRDGMEARAELLGDTQGSAPEHWDDGLRGSRIHLLVTVAARTVEARERARQWLRERVADGIVHEQDADLLGAPKENEAVREHFGFADGLSQPTIKDPRAGPNERPGRGTPRRLGLWDDVAPGEFVLGYPDEDGLAASDPAGRSAGTGASWWSASSIRTCAPSARTCAIRGRRDPPRRGAAWRRRWSGRWPSGAPLVARARARRPLARARGRPRAGAQRLPLRRTTATARAARVGAHIRRANPRDALGWRGLLSKRHRIIRRGMPYGPALRREATPTAASCSSASRRASRASSSSSRRTG